MNLTIQSDFVSTTPRIIRNEKMLTWEGGVHVILYLLSPLNSYDTKN